MTEPVSTTGPQIRLAPGIVFREEDEGYLLYDVERDVLYRGNESGRQILALCDGRRTLAEIVNALAVAHNLPDGAVEPKVRAFLEGLQIQGLAERA